MRPRSEAGTPPTAGARLAGLLVLTGMATLIIETTWMRWLRLLLGATAPAVSATLVATFLGQAVGATVGGRLAARVRDPLRGFAAVAALAVLLSVSMPGLLWLGGLALDPIYDQVRQVPALLVVLRLCLALAAALPAAAALGALLPLAFQAGIAPGGLGSRGAALYGLEILAAACGVVLATMVLPGAIGVAWTYAAGVAGVGVAAGVALAAPPLPASGDTPGDAPGRRPDALPVAPALLALAALSGLGSFAAQVLLVQSFALVHNQSAHAFGSVLAVVLVGLAAGALLMSAAVRRGIAPRVLLALALALAGVSMVSFPVLFVTVTEGLAYLRSDAAWPGYLLCALGLAALAAGPLSLCAGLVLPAVMATCAAQDARRSLEHDAGRSVDHDARRSPEHGAGARMGALLAANTLGAVAGALAGPWLLLPWLGLWGGFLAIGGVYAVAFVLQGSGGGIRAVRAAGAAVAVLAVALAAPPSALPLVPVRADEELLHVEATADGLVAVVARDGQRRIQIDNHYLLGGAADRIHQERQGHVAMLLRPGAERVAFLGAATGSSASAALAHHPEQLSVVELVPSVARLASGWLGADGGSVYQAETAEVVLDDARNFVRATSKRFDLVVADLFLPWRAGAGALYTAEHYAAVRERLRPGGVFCQWLPLYQLSEAELLLITATFTDAFPTSAMFRGDFYGRFPIVALVGFRDAPPRARDVASAAAAAAQAGVRDRWVIHPDAFFALYVGPLSSLAHSLVGHPHNTDDRPRLEMGGARSHGGSKREPFVGRAFTAFAEQVAGRRGDEDPLFPDLWPAARRAREGGLQLQAAGAFYAEGRLAEASRDLSRAAELLPPEVLAEAPADPTAADLWWTEPSGP